MLDEHDVESQIIERLADNRAGSIVSGYIRSQARRMRLIEAGMIDCADLVLAVSEGDAGRFRETAEGSNVEVVPNGVDSDYYRPASQITRIPGRLIFTGSMDWLPN